MKNMLKLPKEIRALIAGIAIITLLFSSMVFAADLNNDANITLSIELKKGDTIIDLNHADLLSDGDTISMLYTWTIDPNAVNTADGDTLSVTIPDGFVLSDVTDQALMANGVQIGAYDIDASNQQVRVTFNDQAQGQGVSEVFVGFSCSLDLSQVGPRDNPVEFDFKINDTIVKTYTIIFDEGRASTPIEENGQFSSSYDANGKVRAIDWNTRINRTYEELSNLNTLISFDDGLVLDPTSVKLYYLDYDLDGNPVKGDLIPALDTDQNPNLVNYILVNDPDNDQFTISFSDGLASVNQPFQIDYTTTIDVPDIEAAGIGNFTSRAEYGHDPAVFSEATEEITYGDKLTKSGVFDRAYNPRTITWTVLANSFEGLVDDGLVIDTLPVGLNYVADSATIAVAQINDDGSLASLAASDPIVPSINAQELSFDLPSDTYRAYEITYETEIDITAFDESSFTNDALLVDKSLALEAQEIKEVQVTKNVSRGEILSKVNKGNSFSTYGDKTLSWQVDMNTYEMVVVDGILEDTISEELAFDESSLVLQKLNIDDSGNKTVDTSVGTGGVLALSSNGNQAVTFTNNDPNTSGNRVLTMDLSKIEEYNDIAGAPGNNNVNYALRLSYVTDVADIHYTDNNANDFSNSVKITAGLDLDGDGIGNGVNDQAIDVTKLGSSNANLIDNASKAVLSTDYQTSRIKWQIKLMPYRSAMTDLVVNDSFSYKGLELDPDSLSITRSGTTLDSTSDYTLSLPDDGTYKDGFKLVFHDDVNNTPDLTPVEGGSYLIQYETKFTREDQNYFNDPSQESNERKYKNTALVSWIDESYDTPQNKSLTKNATKTITEEARDNGSISGILDRAAQVVQWTVNANYTAESHDDYQVDIKVLDDSGTVDKDERDFQSLPAEHLDPNSGDMHAIKVYEYTVNPNGTTTLGALLDPNTYTVTASDDDNFTVTFPGHITKPYRIIYYTELVNESQASYANTAFLGDNDRDVSASVTYDDYDVFVTKNTPNPGEVLDWEVTVNTSMSTIANAKLVDVLGYGHEYREDSLAVYKNDEVDPIDSSEYNATFKILDLATLEQEFELAFINPIEDEYTIKYQTVVFADSTLNISNEASFSGDGISVENQSDSTSFQVIVNDSFGGAQVAKLGFTIIKEDGDNHGVKIPGVEFDLYDENKALIGRLDPTDANGEIAIARFDKGIYYLKEVEPAAGYQPQRDYIELDLTGTEDVTLTIDNYVTRGITIEKQRAGQENVKLEGAVFNISGPIGKDYSSVREATTDENGLIELTGLEFGDYQIQETSAPSGYSRNSHVFTVTLDDNALVVEQVVTNAKKSTAIILPEVEDEPEVVEDKNPFPELEDIEKPKEEEPSQPIDKEEAKDIYVKEPGQTSDPNQPQEGLDQDPEKDVLDDLPPEEIIYKPTVEVKAIDVVKPPEKGSIEVKEDGSIKYIPGDDFDGQDKFTLTVKTEDGDEIEWEIVVDEVVPEGGYRLPATSGLPIEVYLFGGLALIVTGLGFKKRPGLV